MINLLIAEDHKILRDGLNALFINEEDIKVVAETSNPQDAIDIISTGVHIDVVLLGINGNEMDGVEATKYITSQFKKVNVLILSMIDYEDALYKLIGAGARGFVVKNSGNDELLFAIRKVANNGFHICSELVMNILNKNTESYINSKTSNIEVVKLSKREVEVLQLISEGLTNVEISLKLFTSKRTVETHRMNLIAKTKTKNTAELIKFAVKHNLVN